MVQTEAIVNSEFKPRFVGFLCNWCSYASADLAGDSRIQYPPNLRPDRMMCSEELTKLSSSKPSRLEQTEFSSRGVTQATATTLQETTSCRGGF